MPDSEQKNTLEVHSAESGQKLLQFLMRRLSLPQALLHRWIRTGQVRINGGRAKPFSHVQTGDAVRIPPFALGMTHSATFVKNPEDHDSQSSPTTVPEHTPTKHTSPLPLPPVVLAQDDMVIYNKPSGLPVHGGTGHTDSLAERLENHFSHLPFKPTPAHRLDKDTSGLICVAFSYASLRALQDAFAEHSMIKEYLALVHGSWPHDQAQKLTHTLQKRFQGKHEKVHAFATDADEDGKEAISIVRCISRTAKHSLMHIRLITGRTHQIRVQLASQGHPIVGDAKYGTWKNTFAKLKSKKDNTLHLHSWRITFPQDMAFNAQEKENQEPLAGKSYAALPPWDKAFSINELPASLTDPHISR